jgi:hypothetical protein
MSKVLKKWLGNSSSPSSLRIIISIDVDDSCRGSYFELLVPIANSYGAELLIIENSNECTVQAINAAKPHINGDLIIIFSDDTDCFENWDKELLEFSSDLRGKYVIKTSDGIGQDLITMPIFSREYLDSFPYIYHPSYNHMFCDTELTCVANLLGCVINADKFEFKHLHYSKLHHDKDLVDDKNQSTFYTGMYIFKRRLDNNFDIPHSELKGEIPKEIKEWIKSN